jgi:hypothetical protein
MLRVRDGCHWFEETWGVLESWWGCALLQQADRGRKRFSDEDISPSRSLRNEQS